MKRFKYIAILTALFVAVSCTETDVVEQTTLGNSKLVQIVGRVLPYTDCNVSSRSIKNGDETNIKSMTLVIFKEDGSIADSHYITGSSPVFQVERDKLNDASEIYLFANVPENNDAQSIDDFKNVQSTVSGIDIPEEGFPMMGKFVIEKDTDGTSIIPNILEISLSALYAKIVMNIEVRPDQSVPGKNSASFRLDGFTVHNVANAVDFKGNTDNNGNEVVTNDATPVLGDVFEGSIEGSNIAQGATGVQFSFYLPERFLQPNTSAAEYNYPFKGTFDATTDKDQNGIRDEDENYRQRFKPLLVEDNNPAATFVRFFGEYTDHQGHNYNVSYNIYVGSDNYGNFDVVRNTQYNNYITIRGLANSNDQALNEDAISIDHRVDVERVNPIIINFRRETLLDSHFEVRPLRIHTTGKVGSINAVKVEVLNPTTTNWMRLERSFGDGTADGAPKNDNGESIYITEGISKGKRRYFTYNLIDGVNADAIDASLVNSTEVILPLSNNTTECCWIYVDENTAVGDDIRKGNIKVTYGNLNGTTFTPTTDVNYKPLEYVINQRNLFQVTYVESATVSRSYNIEYHEEYLHNYDAEDEYAQTEYEGMKWGLEGIKLSYDHPALYFKTKTGDWANGILEFFVGEVPAYYDFYIKKHDATKMADPKQVELHEYAGYDFCKEIILEVNGASGNNTDESDNIDALALNEKPESAVEYCYNKNKRNAEGQVIWKDANQEDGYNTDNLNWYLPAIDEMEDIVMSTYESENVKNPTYGRFLDFQNKFYWSSQPAYIQNYGYLRWTLIIIPLDYYGTFYYDDIGDTNYDKNNNTDRKDVGSARATKVNYKNSNYEYSTSGTNGYYSYLNTRTDEYSYEGTYNGVAIGSIEREEGNKARTDMARVRCVRKVKTTEN